MPYTTNKHLPKIRRDAARLYRKGWSARKIGRHLGYHHTAVMKWVKRSRIVGDVPILTKSSCPKNVRKPTHPDIEKPVPLAGTGDVSRIDFLNTLSALASFFCHIDGMRHLHNKPFSCQLCTLDNCVSRIEFWHLKG